MARRSPLLALAGYEPSLAAGLSSTYVRHLRVLSMTMLWSALLIGATAGYGMGLAEGSWTAAVVFGGVIAMLILNVVRVVTAGAVSALGGDQHRKRVSSVAPTLLLIALAAFFSQAALLGVYKAEQDSDIAAHRQQLAARFDSIAAHAYSAEEARRERAAYVAKLEASTFISKRLQLLWRTPEMPGLMMLGFVLLAVVPLSIARVGWRRVLLAYRQMGYVENIALVARDRDATERKVAEHLARWPTYVPTRPRAQQGGGA